MPLTDRPSLSVVLPTRDGALGAVLESVLPQVLDVGGEVLVVDGRGDGADTSAVSRTRAGDSVHWVTVADARMPSLRAIGVRMAEGHIIAIGEDHAVPSPSWARAVLEAHDRHADADAVVGCLVNATDRTVAGRANFLAFAAAWTPPMEVLPPGRPPPASTLSFKRRVLAELGDGPGDLDAVLIPRLFTEGRMVADGNVVVFHYQDHGLLWSIANAYASARSGHGYGAVSTPAAERHAAARWVLTNMPRRLWAEAWAARDRRRSGVVDLAAVAVIVSAAGVGAALGMLRGPGRAPDGVA